eukprot:600044-Hanusia_phi.AAC.1
MIGSPGTDGDGQSDRTTRRRALRLRPGPGRGEPIQSRPPWANKQALLADYADKDLSVASAVKSAVGSRSEQGEDLTKDEPVND